MDSRKVPTVETYPMIPPQSELHDAKPSGFGDDRMQGQWEVQDKKLKRTIRLFRLISRLLSLLMSASTLGIMANSLHSYYTTHQRTINGTHAWPQPAPVLWPSYLLLAISFVTFVSSVATVAAYACGGVRGANRAEEVGGYVGYVMMAGLAVAWGVCTGLVKMAEDGRDLWGWSCSPDSDAIQAEWQSYVNFGMLCTTQTGSWWMSVLQAALYLLSFVTYVWAARRLMLKRKMKAAMDHGVAHTF